MRREIFTQWVRDEWLGKHNLKVCLVLVNCTTAHHTTIVLENMELHFLPPNSTAIEQPLNLGVIMNFKPAYSKRVVD